VTKSSKSAIKQEDRPTNGNQGDWLTFNEYLQVIYHEANWPCFRNAFESRELFLAYMDQVRVMRNQLAHFDDARSTETQRDLLRRALRWIETRPRVAAAGACEGPALQAQAKGGS